MGDSLAGGLVPLAGRAGSGTVGSNNLSGGLVPLGNRSRPSFRRSPLDEDMDNGGGSRGGDGRDAEREDPPLGNEGAGNESDPERKVRRRRERKDKGGGLGSSSRRDSPKSKVNSRRRRGSKDSSKHVSRDDPNIFSTNSSPTSTDLRVGRRPSFGHSGASAGGQIGGGADEEDDSYLFVGATAGAKGKKSAGKSATETALDYDSTDSFGLPKVRTGKGSKPHVQSPEPKHNEGKLRPAVDGVEGSNLVSGVSAKGVAAEASGLRDHEEMLYPVAHGRNQSADSTRTDRFLGGTGDMPLRATKGDTTGVSDAATTVATVPAGVPAHGIDLEDDFDSPDEMSERLETAVPVAMGEGGVMSSLRGGRKEPRGHTLHIADLSTPPAADQEERSSIAGSPKTEPSRRRSPSPPSSPRRGRFEDVPTHRTGSAFRPRPGRGLTYGESREDLQAGGSVPPKAEERDSKGPSVRGLDGVRRDGAESAGGTSITTAAVAASRPSMESSLSISRAATIGGESNAEVSGGNDARAEMGLGRLTSKSEARAALESTGVTSEVPAGDGEAARIPSVTRGELTTSGPGIVTKTGAQVPRRSALARADKSESTSRRPRSRGVTFDDDLVGVDALDILPGSSSEDGENVSSGTPPAGESLQSATALPTTATEGVSSPAVQANTSYRVPSQQAGDTRVVCEGTNSDVGGASSIGNGGESGHPVSESRDPAASSAVTKRFSAPMVTGLSPEAARLMEESSSSEDGNPSKTGSTVGDIGSRLGQGGLESVAGTTSFLGRGPGNGGRDQEGMEIDEAKLDLALGFTPSVMEGGRKPRRALPAGRRRRSRTGESPTKRGEEHTAAERNSTSVLSTSAPSSKPETPGMETDFAISAGTLSRVTSKETSERQPQEDTGVAKRSTTKDVQGASTAQPADIGILTSSPAGTSRLVEPSVTGTAAASSVGVSVESSSSSTAKYDTANSLGLTPSRGSGRGMSNNGGNTSSGGDTPADASSQDQNRGVDMKSVDAAVLVSLERQLALLVSEKEASGARTTQGEQTLQRESTVARDAAAAAQARAFGCDAALAEARARIRQLEVEAAEHTSRLAEVESQAASDLRAEQESCLRRISEAATRHQDDLCESGIRHREVLSEVKRLHNEELEDIRQRNAESKTLEALAGQVQASAGAVKLLQAEMMEKKNVSEVSREGHMDARERLIKELEHSARRAQQTAEEEVQRLQGTLMAMDQVMSALRGQNAGERERLRQEHLRMEALQGTMVAEVEAVRKDVDEERERLKERSAALDKEKREAAALARAESQRLADQRVKLETEREKFAALQVSATLAAEEMAQRHTVQEENLNLARQSLEREASGLEARLSCARADLHKADHVRESLDRIRDQDELERRRLKVLAAELERAFEEVQTRTDDTDQRRREAEEVQIQALASAKAATKEREAAQMRSVQVEEAARRLEAERTSIAQARGRKTREEAQSATELSTSRRLKGELSRAVAAQQRRGTKGMQAAADVVLSSRTMPLGRHGGGDGSDGRGETTSDSRIYFDCRAFSGGPADTMIPGLPQVSSIGGADSANASSYERNALPFTGIVAAEATLHAVSCTPPFPGMGIGRELGRLARRAADIRGYTREQSAFLSSSRAARFGSAFHDVAFSPSTAETGAIGVEARPPEIFPEAHSFDISPGVFDVGVGLGQHVTESFGHRVRGQESGGVGVDGLGEALGNGLSSTVIEELEKIEKACTQRSAALEEADVFVGTIGHEEGSVVG
ncbi:unnamed protein product [Scytosiphon promiscuus]